MNNWSIILIVEGIIGLFISAMLNLEGFMVIGAVFTGLGLYIMITK